MSHDGLPARAVSGARAATADRGASATDRRSLLRHALPAALAGAAVVAFAACSSGTTGSSATASSGTTTSSAEASTAASTEASSSAAASSGATSGIVAIVFQPLNGSQILGGAVITDQQDGSSANVQIGIGSTGATDGMPAVLQQGACATAGASGAPGASGSPSESGAPSESGGIGAGASAGASAGAAASSAPSVAASAAAGGSAAPSGSGEAGSPAPSAVTGPPYQLTPLTGGASTTLVATTVSALTSEPYSVVLGTSATDPTPVACADVVPGASRPTTSPAAGASSGASTEPSMGTEPSPSSS